MFSPIDVVPVCFYLASNLQKSGDCISTWLKIFLVKRMLDFKVAGVEQQVYLEILMLFVYFYCEGNPWEHRQRSNQKAD